MDIPEKEKKNTFNYQSKMFFISFLDKKGYKQISTKVDKTIQFYGQTQDYVVSGYTVVSVGLAQV